MFMNTKGISPLIATVLIIGFTVALAALIITWGGQFIRGTQESVEQQAGVQLACSQLEFDITNINCDDFGTNTVKLASVSIASQSNQQIADVILRVTSKDDSYFWVSDPDSRVLSSALPPFGARIITTLPLGNWPTEQSGFKLVEAIAKIIDSQGGQEVACEAGIAKFNIVQSRGEPTGCFEFTPVP